MDVGSINDLVPSVFLFIQFRMPGPAFIVLGGTEGTRLPGSSHFLFTVTLPE